MKELIKVGFCVAYDWEMLRFALPLVYQDADIICLSLDSKFVSWTGETYPIDEHAFYDFIEKIDVKKKIKVYRSNFFSADLSPMQNEVRQRNLIADFLGPGGWHIQLDCDEYFLEFSDFVRYLKSINRINNHFNICCPLVNIFKKVSSGYLYVDPLTKEGIEYIQVATLEPKYMHGRRNDNFNIYVNHTIIHQSWARSVAEVKYKIDNWGHHNDFNLQSFFKIWMNLDEMNYRELRNFHPITPTVWPALALYKANSWEDFIHSFNDRVLPRLSYWQRLHKNSLLASRIKSLIKKVFHKA